MAVDAFAMPLPRTEGAAGFPRHVRAVVRDGRVESIVDATTGRPADPAYPYLPIERLFDQIQAVLDSPTHRLSVTYNATWGYPSRMELDTVPGTSDDNSTVIILAFTPLP